jgi:transcriptional regulator with XRE-family HTH domain
MSNVERLEADISETVRRLKRLAGVSDAQIGRALNLHRAAVNNRMMGHTRWTAAELAQLAAFFEVPVSLLYEDPDTALERAFLEFRVFERSFGQDSSPSGRIPVLAGQSG